MPVPSQVAVQPKQKSKTVLGSLIGIGACFTLLATSYLLKIDYSKWLPWFQITRIEIQADWPLTPSLVEQWLPPLKGQNLIFTDLAPTLRLLQDKKWVSEVTISKNYPDAIRIQVVSKRPAAFFILKDKAHVLSQSGDTLESASTEIHRALDLPFVSVSNPKQGTQWEFSSVVQMLKRMQERLEPGYSVSQISLLDFPFFHLYLQRPHWQILLSFENWERQFPMLLMLLHHPPKGLKEVQKVNLSSAKKAVVSSSKSE